MSEHVTPPDKPDEIEQRIDRILRELEEFCDSVRIFATYRSDKPNVTVELSKGAGSMAAQRGQVTAWIIRENEKIRSDVWAELDDGDGEDDDEN